MRVLDREAVLAPLGRVSWGLRPQTPGASGGSGAAGRRRGAVAGAVAGDWAVSATAVVGLGAAAGQYREAVLAPLGRVCWGLRPQTPGASGGSGAAAGAVGLGAACGLDGAGEMEGVGS